MRTILPWVVAMTLVLAVGAPGAQAGSQGSPDLDDDAGDAMIDGDPSGGMVTAPVLQDGADMVGVWWTFNNETVLQVGVEVANVDRTADTSQGGGAPLASWTYNIDWEFHRAVGNDSDAALQPIGPEGASLTITVTSNADSASCSDGELDTSVSLPAIACLLPSTSFVPDDFANGNGTFYNTDMIMTGSAASQGSSGALSASDDTSEAEPMEAYIWTEGPDPPTGGGQNGGGNGNGGGGGGGGGNGTNGDDEATPGFTTVAVATAGLLAVALWSRRRRD